MKYTETRYLHASELRRVCIEHNWYTCGDCEEYDNLFARLYEEDGCPVHITTEKLAEIATDIWEHSDISDYSITTVMHFLSRACRSCFGAVDE